MLIIIKNSKNNQQTEGLFYEVFWRLGFLKSFCDMKFILYAVFVEAIKVFSEKGDFFNCFCFQLNILVFNSSVLIIVEKNKEKMYVMFLLNSVGVKTTIRIEWHSKDLIFLTTEYFFLVLCSYINSGNSLHCPSSIALSAVCYVYLVA